MNLLSLQLSRSLAPLVFPRSKPAEVSFPATLGLDEEQAAFFRKNGYLIKRDVLDKDLRSRALDYSWAMFPAHFKREDATTWIGELEDCLCSSSVCSRKGRVKFRERVRKEKWLYEMIDRNGVIRSTVEALIGPGRTGKLPYVRGIYPVLPCSVSRLKKPRPHTDGHNFLVGTMSYLSDVGVGGGGFHVWPGSHLVMRHQFTSAAGSGWTKDYHRELYSFACRHRPVEISAPGGSVIFWHHRLAHAAGINRSSNIRHAILADYPATNIEELARTPVSPDPWAHWGVTDSRLR